MKKLIIITLSIITILSIATVTYFNQPEQVTQSPTTIQHEYIITQVSNNEYYGQSTSNDTGIYFTSEYIQSNEPIKEGDTIIAHFENELDDSLLYVVKAETTIKESFIITSIDQEGYVHGELTTGTGEGIFYHIDELTAHNVDINKGDTITIEWTEDNYNNGEWDVIESVTLN